MNQGIFVCLMILLLRIQNQTIHLKYSFEEDDLVAFRFFHGLNDGYYADLGAFDPVFFSTTFYLYGKGWNGLNVEANPIKAARFPLVKSRDATYNYAIGQENNFITLYEFPGFSVSATANQAVAKRHMNSGDPRFQQKAIQYKVPAITIKQICQRFFIKKVNYMNLDIEGLGAGALSVNDWANPKCRPEIIITENSYINSIADKRSVKQILQNAGYKFHSEVNNNVILIDAPVFDHYSKKYEEGTKILQRKKIIDMQFYKQVLIGWLKVEPFNTDFVDNVANPIYFYQPRENTIINLEELNVQSNQKPSKQNRPIIILQMNLRNTALLISSKSYTKQVVKVGEANWFRFNITKQNGEIFSTYIMDWEYQGIKQPKTISLQQNKIDVQQFPKIESLAAVPKEEKLDQKIEEKFSRFETKLLESEKKISQILSEHAQVSKANQLRNNEQQSRRHIQLLKKIEQTKTPLFNKEDTPLLFKSPQSSPNRKQYIFQIIEISLVTFLIFFSICDRCCRKKKNNLEKVQIYKEDTSVNNF